MECLGDGAGIAAESVRVDCGTTGNGLEQFVGKRPSVLLVAMASVPRQQQLAISVDGGVAPVAASATGVRTAQEDTQRSCPSSVNWRCVISLL